MESLSVIAMVVLSWTTQAPAPLGYRDRASCGRIAPTYSPANHAMHLCIRCQLMPPAITLYVCTSWASGRVVPVPRSQ
ncbi:hypothetical protein BJV78DRAFT_82182 [Lactifluus subvellereus]|nr:hypothetical protein BJV78DRAFT_82182 [Lactifluus subvellereus]